MGCSTSQLFDCPLLMSWRSRCAVVNDGQPPDACRSSSHPALATALRAIDQLAASARERSNGDAAQLDSLTALVRGALIGAVVSEAPAARQLPVTQNGHVDASDGTDADAATEQVRAELSASQGHAAELAQRLGVLEAAAAEGPGLAAALEAARAELQVSLLATCTCCMFVPPEPVPL